MKASARAVVLFMVLAVALGTVAAAGTSGKVVQPNGRYLVVFKSDTLPADATSRIVKSGGTVIRAFDRVGVVSAFGDAAFVSKIAKDATVLSVGPEHLFAAPDVRVSGEVTEPDAVASPEPALGPVPATDTYYRYQWDIRRLGSPAVWARLPLSETTPRVAVLDVGVMDTHPDLVGQVDLSVATSYCATGAGFPMYTTYIDFDTYPNWTPADGCSPLGFTDYEAHGTHVAGTIAAKFGGGRVVGVAPDAKIGAFKVFDVYASGGNLYLGAFDTAIFEGIIEATLDGYPVISMSLGSHGLRNDKGSNASYLAWDRVAKWANRAGALIVASAGNSAYDVNGTLFHVPSDLPTVVNTSASAACVLLATGSPATYDVAPGGDCLASYSNYGAAVDIAGPGGDAASSSTPIQYWIVNDAISPSGAATYYGMTGTSMATPHVSAVAAWVRALHPDWTPGDVRSWLKTTAEVIGSRQQFGAGLVDADAATQ